VKALSERCHVRDKGYLRAETGLRDDVPSPNYQSLRQGPTFRPRIWIGFIWANPATPVCNHPLIRRTVWQVRILYYQQQIQSNVITVQQDATYSVYYMSVGSSTCFGCWHPSSGTRTTVITASGNDQPGLLPSALVVDFQLRLYSVYYISVGSSTCFGCWHPSSGARTTVITASGNDQPGLLPSAFVVDFQLRLYSVYFISVGSSTRFGCWQPSSGARTTVITASGID